MVRIFTSATGVRHQVPASFPECPERLTRILDRLRTTDWPVENVAPNPDSRRLVESVHDPSYVARFEQAVESGAGWLDSGDNPLSPGTWEAAWGAVDTTLAAVDWALGGERRIGCAVVRPPGHHAEREFAMGFCYLNNVAIAAEHAIRQHGLERVAIVDPDVHHGNGTQHLLAERGDILYASLHQWPFFPGSGAEDEIGIGPGRGATVNVPLPAGTGDAPYRRAFESRILPAVREFAPELLLISAGFDAWRSDPLGGMQVTQGGFEHWGRMLGGVAASRCGGRSVSLLEGGYDLDRLGELVERYLVGLTGSSPATEARV